MFSFTSIFNFESDSYFSISKSAGLRGRSTRRKSLTTTSIPRKIYLLAAFCLICLRRSTNFLRRRRGYFRVRDFRSITSNIKKKHNFSSETTAASVYYLILHQIYYQISGRSGYLYNKITYSLLLLRCAVLLLGAFWLYCLRFRRDITRILA